jgi:sugar phosphate isomerase/epimerase
MKFGAMDEVLGKKGAELFARAKSLGMDGVEINLKISELKSDQWKTLARQAKDHGLEIPSAVLGEHNNGGLASWWRKKEADDEVRAALNATAEMGVSTLLVPFFFVNEPKGKTHRDAVADRLIPLCGEAQKLGIILAFEGVLAAKHLQEMAARINSPAFGVYFDPANMTWCDFDVPGEIRTLGKLLRQSHAKEARVFTGDARLGEGRVDHAVCAAALKSIGYDRWIVLETPVGTDAEVGADLAFARKHYG